MKLTNHFRMDMETLDLQKVEESLKERLDCVGRPTMLDSCRQLQLTVYVMCGGGFIGRFAAEQPEDFYIDDRAATVYPSKAIFQAVEILKIYAKILGLDPHNLNPSKEMNLDFFDHFMNHHGCGIF